MEKKRKNAKETPIEKEIKKPRKVKNTLSKVTIIHILHS